ncbi:MAG TPA: MaoC family dehydratase [Burkholderiales bacterium]|jgi:3-hydroxybutyryl-CoA dehydratase|nr:MaoC family dehydratase [Burkholderiales bacterium]
MIKVGTDIKGPVRLMTPERIEWYDSAMLSAAKGELTRVTVNIHTDEDYARSEGLPAIIADGMISTNWCSEMMIEHFGLDYIERGELRTRFIKPTFLGVTVSVRGRVTAADPQPGGAVVYKLDVWCEDETGLKLTVGDAKVEVRPT